MGTYRRKTLELLKNRMLAAQNQSISRKKQHYIAMTAKLDAMSPLKVLTRGYAMAQDETGQVVRSVKQTSAGAKLTISVSDGAISATVIDVKEKSL